MKPSLIRPNGRARSRNSGQIIVIGALAMLAVISVVALVLEGGNAYAQQRRTQNAADATANAGAAVLSLKLAGATKTDLDVANAVNTLGNANGLDVIVAYYTDVKGKFMDSTGAHPVAKAAAAVVGNGILPSGAQGVSVDGSRTFGTFIARAIGFQSFTSSATAIAVTGGLVGGVFLPVVFPINIVDCETNGDLGTGEANWTKSKPGANPGDRPIGQEYIVPLCKTGAGSFQILDFDPKLKCDEEINAKIQVQLNLPQDVASDNGNDCAKKIVDAVNSKHGTVVMVPICDGDCVTTGGSKATYHIVKVAAFWLDYMADSNNVNKIDAKCQQGFNAIGQPIIPIRGNGSSGCVAGYFVRYVSAGTVGDITVTSAAAIGIQLIK